jgi:hypothetical protein
MRLYVYLILAFSLLAACARQPELVQEQPLALSKEERERITDRLEDAIGPSFRHHRQGNQDPELIKWRLRSYAFDKIGPGLEQAKNDLNLLGGYDDFIKLIDETIGWRKKMQKSDAETVYQTAEEFQRKLYSIPRDLFFSASRWESLTIYPNGT